MTRFRRMFKKSPGRTVAALAVLALAVAIAVGTGADLTTGSAQPGNFATAGALNMSGIAGQAKFTVRNVQPGFGWQSAGPDGQENTADDVYNTDGSGRAGTIMFQNVGTLTGSFALKAADGLGETADTLIPEGPYNALDTISLTNPLGSVQNLSKGLRWKVTKMAPCTGTSGAGACGQACPNQTFVAGNLNCYSRAGGTSLNGGTPDAPDATDPAAGTLYDATNAGSAGTVDLGSVAPGGYQVLYFHLYWPTSDSAASHRAGIRDDWSIQVNAAS